MAIKYKFHDDVFKSFPRTMREAFPNPTPFQPTAFEKVVKSGKLALASVGYGTTLVLCLVLYFAHVDRERLAHAYYKPKTVCESCQVEGILDIQKNMKVKK